MKKKLFVFLIPIVLITISLFPRKENKELVSNTDNLVSFTVDGVESKTMPTKGSGYIANKITCKNGSIITFDNDNYIIEVEKLESADACKIDFSKEIGSNTVTVTISDTSKIDSTSKTTTEGGKVEFYFTGEPDSITGGEYTLSDGKLVVNNVTSNIVLNITMGKSLYDKLLADKTTITQRVQFGSVLTTDNTKTLYTATENNTTVYYFAGNATDNWVKFGKDSSNNDLYWRIIRTNSDGSIRLLYHATSTDSVSAYINTSTSYNATYSDSMYVGYMYGTSGSLDSNRTNENDSTIKKVIDSWYENNLKNNYGKYLSLTAVYCNDRNVSDGTYCPNCSTDFSFAGRTRIDTNKTPSYDCENVGDKFTVDASTGNGSLKYPIALMTSDEVVYAGGMIYMNATTWFYYNSVKTSSTGNYMWWLMTPFLWNNSGRAGVLLLDGQMYPGNLKAYYVHNASAVRPVISLKSCVKYLSGDGSATNPYIIEETSTGC